MQFAKLILWNHALNAKQIKIVKLLQNALLVGELVIMLIIHIVLQDGLKQKILVHWIIGNGNHKKLVNEKKTIK